MGTKMNFKYLSILLSLMSFHCFGDTSTLMQESGGELDFSSSLKVQKSLKLDDPFLIQLYSSWRALGALSPQSNSIMDLIFSGQNEKAFLALDSLKEAKISGLKKPTELYLLYKLGYFQTFLSQWVDHAVSSGFIGTELSLALDHVVAPQASAMLLSSGFYLDKQMDEKLSKLEKVELRLNYSLQAYRSLRRGEDGVKWIGKLSLQDELRLHLAHTAILAYGKKGMLGASGKLIKKVVEPWMQTSKDPREISLYYITLARLLYQAKAYKQAEEFYFLIPETSRYFIEARTEALWVQLQQRNYSKAKGELASLRMSVFNDRFYPEVHLVSAIGNTMLCQFSEAKNSINDFISTNQYWAKKIEENIASNNAPIVEENFYVKRMRNQNTSLKRELVALEKLGVSKYNNILQDKVVSVSLSLKDEAHRQWKNRKLVLEGALYKMKFVRIELLSRMRAFSEGLKDALAGVDSVKTYSASSVKKNQMEFPNDGMLWGDELFKMNAVVQNECIQGKFYAKK
jgi:hypothetical protein